MIELAEVQPPLAESLDVVVAIGITHASDGSPFPIIELLVAGKAVPLSLLSATRLGAQLLSAVNLAAIFAATARDHGVESAAMATVAGEAKNMQISMGLLKPDFKFDDIEIAPDTVPS